MDDLKERIARFRDAFPDEDLVVIGPALRLLADCQTRIEELEKELHDAIVMRDCNGISLQGASLDWQRERELRKEEQGLRLALLADQKELEAENRKLREALAKIVRSGPWIQPWLEEDPKETPLSIAEAALADKGGE